MKGALNDNTDLHVFADSNKNTTVSAIYHPNSNLDLVVTNKFNFDDNLLD